MSKFKPTKWYILRGKEIRLANNKKYAVTDGVDVRWPAPGGGEFEGPRIACIANTAAFAYRIVGGVNALHRLAEIFDHDPNLLGSRIIACKNVADVRELVSNLAIEMEIGEKVAKPRKRRHGKKNQP